MKQQPLINLLHRIGVVPQDVNNGWVRCSCPLAYHTHESKQDEHPSCGFKINDEGQTVSNCFTCGVRTLGEILHVIRWTRGISDSIVKYYLEHEIIGGDDSESSVEYEDKYRPLKTNKAVPVPSGILDRFLPVEHAENYLTQRGIDLYLAKSHGLVYCESYTTPQNRTWKKAIISPIRDIDFNPYWLHCRSVVDKAFWHGKPEHFGVDYAWGRSDSWFGIEFLNPTKPITVVEGLFDCLRLKSLGWENVIASHGPVGKNSAKLERLVNLKPKFIYLGFDADQAGKKFKEVVRQKVNCETIDLDWSIVGAKDPGELTSKQDLEKVLESKRKNFKFIDKFRRVI